MIYRPHDYQSYATRFIEEHPISALILEMGLGKSVITLTAVEHLMHDSFEVRKVLVIAPLRGAKSTWPDEIRKWDHLSSLSFSVAVGTRDERMAALRRNADITIINRENIQWLVEESGVPFDYDMVVIDELWLSSAFLTEARGSDASSGSTGKDGFFRISGTRWSSSPTN